MRRGNSGYARFTKMDRSAGLSHNPRVTLSARRPDISHRLVVAAAVVLTVATSALVTSDGPGPQPSSLTGRGAFGPTLRCTDTFHQQQVIAQYHTPDASVTAVNLLSSRNAWAVGFHGGARASTGPVGGFDSAQIDYWDGRSWRSVAPAFIHVEAMSLEDGLVRASGRLGYLTAVDATSSTDVWVAGSAELRTEVDQCHNF